VEYSIKEILRVTQQLFDKFLYPSYSAGFYRMAHLVAVHNIKGLAYALMSQAASEIVMGLEYFVS